MRMVWITAGITDAVTAPSTWKSRAMKKIVLRSWEWDRHVEGVLVPCSIWTQVSFGISDVRD